jgi:hypothetical protein
LNIIKLLLSTNIEQLAKPRYIGCNPTLAVQHLIN